MKTRKCGRCGEPVTTQWYTPRRMALRCSKCSQIEADERNARSEARELKKQGGNG